MRVRFGWKTALAGVAALAVGAAAALGETASPSAKSERRAAAAPSAAVRLVAVGDIAMVETAEASRSYFTGVARYLARGNVTLGNLEGTLTTRGSSKCGSGSESCFAFRAPPRYARLLRRAGFDVLNLANNHSYDFGTIGQADTVAALRGSRLAHTGRPGERATLRKRGVSVAVVGFAPYPWAQSLLDVAGAARLVRRAAARADVVVVTMHAGAEGAGRTRVRPGAEIYLGEPRGNAVLFARAMVRAGADLVVGHGPHVLRGIEWYRGRLIAYSLGNFAAHHTLAVSGVLGVSAILRVRLRADGSWVGGKLVATRLVGAGVPTLDPSASARPLVDRLSRQDFGRSAVRVARSAELLPPRAEART